MRKSLAAGIAVLAVAGCDGPDRPAGPDEGETPVATISLSTDSVVDRSRIAGGTGLVVRIAGAGLPHPSTLGFYARAGSGSLPFFTATHPINDTTLVLDYTVRTSAAAIAGVDRIVVRAIVSANEDLADSAIVRLR